MCDDKGAEVVQVQFRDRRVSNDRKIPRTAAAGGCWISKLRSDYSVSGDMTQDNCKQSVHCKFEEYQSKETSLCLSQFVDDKVQQVFIITFI